MSQAPADYKIVREFGLSYSDFFRIFPRIEPDFERVSAQQVRVVRADGRALEIDLSVEQVRRIATLKIPYVELTFRFSGWSENQRLEFFEKFDRSFQKGGG